MKIAVLVKQVPDTAQERTLDPATGMLDRVTADNVLDEINERALEVALRYKDANKGTEVVAVSMGPSTAAKGLRKALSMGADTALHVLDDDLSGADAARTAVVLATALRHVDADLVVAGNESTDGRGGVVPAMIAEHLGLPLFSALDRVELSDRSVTGERSTESGTLRASVVLPAVVSVTERCAEARFPSFKGIMTAKRKPLAIMSLAELGGLEAGGAARSVIVSTTVRPARSAGRKIVDTGNAGTDVAEFLHSNRLV